LLPDKELPYQNSHPPSHIATLPAHIFFGSAAATDDAGLFLLVLINAGVEHLITSWNRRSHGHPYFEGFPEINII